MVQVLHYCYGNRIRLPRKGDLRAVSLRWAGALTHSPQVPRLLFDALPAAQGGWGVSPG